MTWEILWALVLGFALSGAVQAVVSKAEMTRLLPDDSPRSLAVACGLGAASSSCSYAAVALARSIFRKGANFTAAMGFEFASTNLVIELGIILAILIGWQFTAAEFVGGVLMVVILALLFRSFLSPQLLEMAKRHAERQVHSYMQGHGEMDMSVTGGSIWSRVTSPRGFTAISHYFVMVGAGLIVEGLFQLVGIVPSHAHAAKVIEGGVRWNSTTVLNIVFLVLAAILVVRFLRTNGLAMLRMMNEPTDDHAAPAEPGEAMYTCPMHPEVVQRGPGRCPKCGMELVPAEETAEHGGHRH